MAKISPNLQHLTDELPNDKRAEVEEAIATSPYLRQMMTEAVNANTLQNITLGTPGANEGGHYDHTKKTIVLSPDTFTLIDKPSKRVDAITSTLGHETGHALYADRALNERWDISRAISIEMGAAGQGGEFDATALAGGYLNTARRDEAMAEIHGWNALASRIEYVKGAPPSRQEMLQRANASTDCVDGPDKAPRLAPGILLDPDMQMSDTRLPKAGPINLEPVAQCHFDQSRKVLGAQGAADYRNYYGAYLMQEFADNLPGGDNPPRIKLDMARLGLDKAQIESTGLKLGENGLEIIDTSHRGYKPIVIRGGSGMQGTPDNEPETTRATRHPTQGQDSAPSTPAPLLMTDPHHIAHGGWRDARRGLEELEGPQWQTRSPAEQTQRSAALFTGALQQDPTFTGIDRVLPSEKTDPLTGKPLGVIAMQGPTEADYHRRALVKEDVLNTMPLDVASRASEEKMLGWQETVKQDLQRSLEQSQQQAGMTRSIGGRTLHSQQSGDAGGGE
jgi:hypothetical protein